MIGWGSTVGQLDEAREALTAEGYSVGHLHITVCTLPLGERAGGHRVGRNRPRRRQQRLRPVAAVIQLNVGHYEHVHECRKFSGDPFNVFEIVARAKEVLAERKSVKEVG